LAVVLDCPCVATVEVLCNDADSADCDRQELLKIVRACIIICLPDGASLCSPREDAGGIG
jgi:hypothetical protein